MQLANVAATDRSASAAPIGVESAPGDAASFGGAMRAALSPTVAPAPSRPLAAPGRGIDAGAAIVTLTAVPLRSGDASELPASSPATTPGSLPASQSPPNALPVASPSPAPPLVEAGPAVPPSLANAALPVSATTAQVSIPSAAAAAIIPPLRSAIPISEPVSTPSGGSAGNPAAATVSSAPASGHYAASPPLLASTLKSTPTAAPPPARPEAAAAEAGTPSESHALADTGTTPIAPPIAPSVPPTIVASVAAAAPAAAQASASPSAEPLRAPLAVPAASPSSPTRAALSPPRADPRLAETDVDLTSDSIAPALLTPAWANAILPIAPPVALAPAPTADAAQSGIAGAVAPASAAAATTVIAESSMLVAQAAPAIAPPSASITAAPALSTAAASPAAAPITARTAPLPLGNAPAETPAVQPAAASRSAAVTAPLPASRDGPADIAAPLFQLPSTPVEALAAEAATAPVRLATQPPQLAHNVGLAIARQLAAEGDTLHIRLDPAELGRIDVRMSFDDRGNLRAVLGADSALSLDILRRDSADLGRALTDAGVRADSQSFRFESRSDGRGADPGQQRPTPPRVAPDAVEPLSEAPDPARFQPLRWRGQVDVLA